MKLKNVTAKLIGILGRDLKPDEQVEVSQSVVDNPSVKTLIDMGFLTVDDFEEKIAEAKKQAFEEAKKQALEEVRRQAQEEAKAQVEKELADPNANKESAKRPYKRKPKKDTENVATEEVPPTE